MQIYDGNACYEAGYLAFMVRAFGEKRVLDVKTTGVSIVLIASAPPVGRGVS